MPSCTAQALEDAAATRGLFRLSHRDLKEATLYALCTGANQNTTAAQLLAGATTAGYDKYSDADLDAAIAQAVCQALP